ncbi:hypothetical protein ACTFTM_14145 [Micromonospora sp. RB23]
MLIAALVVVVIPSIGALLWIALSSAEEMGNVAPAVVPAISAITLATISAITLVLRKRPPRSRR